MLKINTKGEWIYDCPLGCNAEIGERIEIKPGVFSVSVAHDADCPAPVMAKRGTN